jgi:hypothetical protein
MRRRVFISYKRKVDTHSAGDSEELADALRAVLESAGYDVFIDKQIEGGKLWNSVITKNLATCDGAVALLSEGALSSSWVQHELSVLSFRKKTSKPEIHFEVVVLDGSLLERLKAPPFDAMGIAAEQVHVPEKKLGVVAGANEFAGEDSLPALLGRKLAAVLPKFESERDLQLNKLRAYLEKFPGAFDQLDDLFDNAPGANDIASRARKLAENLLDAALAAVINAVQILTAEAGHAEGARAEVRSLVELVFPNWVNAEAAATLAMVAATGNFAALNAHESRTCEQYVRRAKGAPNKRWEAVPLHDAGTERSCVEQAEAVLAKKIPWPTARKPLDIAKSKSAADEKELAERVRDKRFFPIVHHVADAEALLALGRPWLCPLLMGDQSDAELGKRGVRLLPLLTAEEELDRRDDYEALLQQIDESGK